MVSSAPAFFGACADWRITVLDLPTAYWHELTAQLSRRTLHVPDTLRLVILGGEKALAGRVREWRAAVGRRVRLLNTYGPTETTVVATMCDLTGWDPADGEVPIGRAIPNVQARVLNRGLTPAKPGDMGELCIGGAGLARGYVNEPALTAERFVPDPGSHRPGARLYLTGDLVKQRPDGLLEFAGRLDDQVKLRGHRIEPGEIETVLAQHPSIREAAVVVREDHAGDRRLVAYLVGFDSSLSVARVRGFLQQRLPHHMVPSAFVTLDRLPRTIQQKVDRALLPAPAQAGAEPSALPSNEVEQKIAAIWSDLLHRDRIGVAENFFDLGGHSLLVIQLHARLCETFGGDLSLVDLFSFSTIQSQAAQLTKTRVDAAPTLDAVRDRASRQRLAFSAPRQLRPAGMVVE
jgi:acyl-coenzyme A synthetase/AMP-(fatty) acid ligase